MADQNLVAPLHAPNLRVFEIFGLMLNKSITPNLNPFADSTLLNTFSMAPSNITSLNFLTPNIRILAIKTWRIPFLPQERTLPFIEFLLFDFPYRDEHSVDEIIRTYAKACPILRHIYVKTKHSLSQFQGAKKGTFRAYSIPMTRIKLNE